MARECVDSAEWILADQSVGTCEPGSGDALLSTFCERLAACGNIPSDEQAWTEARAHTGLAGGCTGEGCRPARVRLLEAALGAYCRAPTVERGDQIVRDIVRTAIALGGEPPALAIAGDVLGSVQEPDLLLFDVQIASATRLIHLPELPDPKAPKHVQATACADRLSARFADLWASRCGPPAPVAGVGLSWDPEQQSKACRRLNPYECDRRKREARAMASEGRHAEAPGAWESLALSAVPCSKGHSFIEEAVNEAALAGDTERVRELREVHGYQYIPRGPPPPWRRD